MWCSHGVKDLLHNVRAETRAGFARRFPATGYASLVL